MTSVKTAISLEEGLLERIDRRAQELSVSRSRFLAEAAEERLRRQESREMKARLDEVYADGEPPEERKRRKALLRKRAARLGDDW